MFKKILAVVAALATVASLSVPAFATGETASHDAGAVTVTGYAAVTGATQYTVMVFDDDGFETTDPETGVKTYDNSKIYYINQGADPTILLAGMLVKATNGENALPVGDYTVRIGNDKGNCIDLDLPITKQSDDVNIATWGDVDLKNGIGVDDINAIVSYLLGTANTYGDYTVGSCITNTSVTWGDLDTKNGVGVDDINAIVSYLLGTANTYGNYTMGQSAVIKTNN